jgi:hypothetical protein
LLGTVADAWQIPLTDVGNEGIGGKYLILPPDYKGESPVGYIPLHPKTCNTFTIIRSILASSSAEDEQRGDALVKQIKIYPLAKADNPPAERGRQESPYLLDVTLPAVAFARFCGRSHTDHLL